MLEQLKKLEERYIQLEQLLASHEQIADRAQYNKLAKELSDIKLAVTLFREYKGVSKEAEDLAAVLSLKQEKDFLSTIQKGK